MERAIYGGSLASALFLLVGTYVFPKSPIMWLAGMSIGYVIFRVLMAVMLVTALVTHPPRKLYLRIALGVMAAVLVGWGLNLVAQDSMKLLDIILFLELGIAFGLAALEVNEVDISDKVATKTHGKHPTAHSAA